MNIDNFQLSKEQTAKKVNQFDSDRRTLGILLQWLVREIWMETPAGWWKTNETVSIDSRESFIRDILTYISAGNLFHREGIDNGNP